MLPTGLPIWLFVAAAPVLVLLHGPAVLYLVARGSHWGRRAALVPVVGVHTGDLCPVVAHCLASLRHRSLGPALSLHALRC